MRFLVDECTGPAVSASLRKKSHEVFCVFEEARGISDDEVISKAFSENRIIITNDKDFGEKVYRENFPHCGIIFLRLQDERAKIKISVVEKLLENYSEKLPNAFVVVTEKQIRFGKV